MLSVAKNVFRPSFTRTFAVPSGRAFKHTLPPLPYAYDALEPYISEEIMKLHHSKHHQTYVNGLNAAEEAYTKADSTAKKIALLPSLKFNGGGHINHSLFWTNLAPVKAGGGQLVSGPLETAFVRDFGSFDEFKKIFNTTTAAVQGSGWGWLGYEKFSRKLEIVTTANQDPLLTHIPIIGIDVWEHAFYLQYKNVKPDYLSAIWNVINFQEAENRLLKASE